ncbi:MAG TPA: hypothetical protein VFB06_15780 [Streptosporangiaceae bacterium]|nr:hypothetical protein [Streptosporangiaceae bacterium]
MRIARRFVQHKVRYWTVLAAGLITLTALLSGTLSGQAAQAMTRSSAPSGSAAVCRWIGHGGNVTDIAVHYCDNGTVIGMDGVYTNSTIDPFGGYGHFEFYGPHGEIGNTADGNAANGEGLSFAAESAPGGSLWCGKYWALIGSYTLLDNNCVAIP